MVKLIDSANKEIEFIEGEKKFPIINFLNEFLAWALGIEKRRTIY